MADKTTVEIEGLDEFRRDLRRVNPALGKAIQRAHKTISTKVANEVRPAVQRLPSPGGTRAVRGITPRATQKHAQIAFSRAQARKPLWANILGAYVHPVFGRRFPVKKMKRRIWQPHLGSHWQPEQLYGAGPVLKHARDTFAADEYLDAFTDALREAFPGA